MNKVLTIFGLIIFFAIVGVGAYFYTQTSSATVEEGSVVHEETSRMSLRELMGIGVNQKCTFSHSDPETGSVEGTSYIAGERVRSDFSGTYPENGSYEGSMIMDGDYMYTWTTEMEQGVKMRTTDGMPDIAEEASQLEESEQSFDPTVEMQYECSSWSPDESMFTPPTHIEFMDFSAQMDQIQEMQEMTDGSIDIEGSEVMDDPCSVCASLSGEAAASCRESLGCE